MLFREWRRFLAIYLQDIKLSYDFCENHKNKTTGKYADELIYRERERKRERERETCANKKESVRNTQRGRRRVTQLDQERQRDNNEK